MLASLNTIATNKKKEYNTVDKQTNLSTHLTKKDVQMYTDN